MMSPGLAVAPLLAALVMGIVPASASTAPQTPRQTEADGYTRYELLEPGSGKFRIIYEVTATTPGATAYFNPIREGSVATDERVLDPATGRPLRFEVVDGEAAARGGISGAEPDSHFIRVTLARPVPANGEGRIVIDKTYEDQKSYYREGDLIVFDRSLGVKRNSVVLPPSYELVSSNYPAQVLREPDGRLSVSFWNITPAPAPLLIKARPGRATHATPGHINERARPRRRARS